MEIKAFLDKTYTEDEKINFIIEQNHRLGYEIRETETRLEAWGYTEEEIAQQERERIAQLTMTALDLIGYIQKEGLSLEQINNFLEENIPLKMQLTYCQNVYCNVVCRICPITIDRVKITENKVISWFIDKEEK